MPALHGIPQAAPQVLRRPQLERSKRKGVRIMQLKNLAGIVFSALVAVGAAAKDKSEETPWVQTHDAREKYFASAIGPLPKDLIKLHSLSAVWPGGGLLVIPAPRLGANLAVYTTSGFTNTDMPTDVRMVGFKRDAAGKQVAGRLEKKTPARKLPGAAGYGYELMVVAPKDADWPLYLLQWAVNTELVDDSGLLERVEGYDGFIVTDLDLGEPERVNVLITRALAPLPTGTQLPTGKMEILAATVITPEEARWARKNRRDALLQRLKDAGVGQISKLKRESVVR
jgi:hypothetical protein